MLEFERDSDGTVIVRDPKGAILGSVKNLDNATRIEDGLHFVAHEPVSLAQLRELIAYMEKRT